MFVAASLLALSTSTFFVFLPALSKIRERCIIMVSKIIQRIMHQYYHTIYGTLFKIFLLSSILFCQIKIGIIDLLVFGSLPLLLFSRLRTSELIKDHLNEVSFYYKPELI